MWVCGHMHARVTGSEISVCACGYKSARLVGVAWHGMVWCGGVWCGVRVGWVAAGLQASRERVSSYMSKRFDDNICITHSRKKYAVAMAQGQVVRY